MGDKILLACIVQNECGEFMLNLTIMSKEGNVSVAQFESSHDNEGGVDFYGVFKRYGLWLFREFIGNDLYNQCFISP